MEMHILMYDYQKKKKKWRERERNGGVWDSTSSYIILSSLSTGIIGRTIDCILCTDLKEGVEGWGGGSDDSNERGPEAT